jgi:hypothetical protein
MPELKRTDCDVVAAVVHALGAIHFVRGPSELLLSMPSGTTGRTVVPLTTA